MAISVTLTDQEEKKLISLMNAADKSAMGLLAIKNLSEGRSFTDVAKMLFLTPEELQKIVNDFHKDGLKAFLRKK